MEKEKVDIGHYEKAISEKYGEETIQHPKADWDEKKEKEYLSQMKKTYRNRQKQRNQQNRVEQNGVFVSEKLLNKESSRECSVCHVYSFSSENDVYMSKYDCCYKCYIVHVEDREERWESGWRPSILEEK